MHQHLLSLHQILNPIQSMHLWDRLWIGADLATMDADIGIGHIQNAALAVRDGCIDWIGTCEQLAALQWSASDTVDAQGMWITPGLIDCHTHLVYAGNRSSEFRARQNGASYEEIARAGGGILSTVRATRAAEEQSLFEQSLPRAQALISEGVTTLEIKSGYGLDLQSEVKMLRVARCIGIELDISVATTFLGAHTVPPEYKGRADEYVGVLCEEMLPHIARERLADAVDAFCEHIAFSPDQTRRIFTVAKDLGFALHLHADQLSDAGGGEIAAQFDALSADHLEHASNQSLERMAERGIVAGILPGAFYYLRQTVPPPVRTLRSLGIPMAIATDCNPGTSPMASILLAMNMACVLFDMKPDEALRGVTCNAARGLGLAHDRGRLREGMRADLAVWRIDQAEQLAVEMGAHRPIDVVVAGRSILAR